MAMVVIIVRHFRPVCSQFRRCSTRKVDMDYFLNPQNRDEILRNVKRRKVNVSLSKLLEAQSDPQAFTEYALKFPNRSHPDILGYSENPVVVQKLGQERKFPFKPLTFENIARHLNLVRTENISNFVGPRSYYLIGDLAKLEDVLVQYALNRLLSKGFLLVSVPDILDRSVIEACGMETHGERNQVYSLDKSCGSDVCLSGTAEMGLGSYLRGRQFAKEELPLRLASVSRCFRAETSKIAEEKGIYRVHQFTKVEMFAVTSPETSEEVLQEFRIFQEETFATLGLQLRTLDMPQEELGAQAYRKYDVEAWLPGRRKWAELSSTSDCSDYQSRRLGITSRDRELLHTVNGTACAVPRLIMSIVETHQNEDKSVSLPEPLVSLMGSAGLTRSQAPRLSVYKAYQDK